MSDKKQLELDRLMGVIDFTPKLQNGTVITANYNKSYDILDFKESDVDLHFIAESLSKLCRFNGHTGESIHDFLSVAQHSVMVSEAILLTTGDPIKAMQGLLHDTAEAFIGDIITPLKRLLSHIIKPIEENIEMVIFSHFNVPFPPDEIVKHVDNNICQYELTFAVHRNTDTTYDFWSIEDSYFKFMEMYRRLQHLIHIKNEITS